MFKAALFTVAEGWKQPRYLWTDKRSAVRADNGTLARLTEDIPTPASMWAGLEDIVLSDRSQTKRDKSCRISLMRDLTSKSLLL